MSKVSDSARIVRALQVLDAIDEIVSRASMKMSVIHIMLYPSGEVRTAVDFVSGSTSESYDDMVEAILALPGDIYP